MNIVYLNNEFVPLEHARVSVLDRGFLFADGVYEVIPVYGGRPFRLRQHLQRLQDSLDGIRLANPYPTERWRELLRRLIDENGGGEQSIYLQITRGAQAKRDHLFPVDALPTVFLMSSPLKTPPQRMLQEGMRLITLPDIRWQHCHLKTIALLPNVLMRQNAEDAGMDEAVLVRNGLATECTTANLFVVERDTVITPPKGPDLLPGITRDLVLELLRADGIDCREESIAVERLPGCSEIWISSSTREVLPVTQLDGQPLGDGHPGRLWQRARTLYNDYKTRLIAGSVEQDDD